VTGMYIITILWPHRVILVVLALGLVIFGILFGAYGTVFWLPQVVHEMGFSNLATGYVQPRPSSPALLP
jgi:hypothetical protein